MKVGSKKVVDSLSSLGCAMMRVNRLHKRSLDSTGMEEFDSKKQELLARI